MKVQFRVYLVTGLFLLVVATVYWILSDEDAGTVMLGLSGVLALIIAAWLGIQLRRPVPAAVPATEPTTTDVETLTTDEWLPHASVWPFWIGAGGTFAAMGLTLSPWLLIPGVIVLLIGVVGWAIQSRNRD